MLRYRVSLCFAVTLLQLMLMLAAVRCQDDPSADVAADADDVTSSLPPAEPPAPGEDAGIQDGDSPPPPAPSSGDVPPPPPKQESAAPTADAGNPVPHRNGNSSSESPPLTTTATTATVAPVTSCLNCSRTDECASMVERGSAEESDAVECPAGHACWTFYEKEGGNVTYEKYCLSWPCENEHASWKCQWGAQSESCTECCYGADCHKRVHFTKNAATYRTLSLLLYLLAPSLLVIRGRQ